MTLNDTKNVYLSLTNLFNNDKKRVVITSGQAVVLHKLAVMSKDGDWIIKEDAESLEYVLKILEEKNATYRFGAPLDYRWLQHGWSSHFEFIENGIRVRCDFFSRPPRINNERLSKIWQESASQQIPYVGLYELAEIERTDRLKDYAIIGELARLMNTEDQLLFSQSAEDIIQLSQSLPTDSLKKLSKARPLLRSLHKGADFIDDLISKERRKFMKLNKTRIESYIHTAKKWSDTWIDLSSSLANLKLTKAHEIITKEAEKLLPFEPRS